MSSTATVAHLRQKIDRMQAPKLAAQTLPTDPALAELFTGGALRRGCTYAVEGSLQLALTLITKASNEDIWCGIVGLPDIGIEAVRDLGIRLDRLILIPAPDKHTLAAVSSLAEVLGIIVTGPLTLSPHQNERLTSRLRDHRSTLITVISPTQSYSSPHNVESKLTVEASRWSGLEAGFGLLTARELAVRSYDRNGTHSCVLRFERHRVCCVTPQHTPQLRVVHS